ncbi:hypothetical protein AB0O76_12300 [Streptomyces sp. NPDC086554]|uniref:hypothetical protein n=1 Tax=Streptomyces sp. NPDC086554 TaxID=3154864 RepID=UPI00343E5BED
MSGAVAGKGHGSLDEQVIAYPDKPVIVCLDEPRGDDGGGAWRQCADVLYAIRPRLPLAEATALSRQILDRHPGCVLALVPALVPARDEHWVARVRSGVQVVIGPPPPAGAEPHPLAAVRLASALYAALVTPGTAAAPPGGGCRSR